jgi:hypothetical protein
VALFLRILLGTFIAGTLALWLVFQIDYRVTRQSLEVRFFNRCIRRIPLADIRYVNKRRKGPAEFWWNTFFPRKRVLVIHRRTGWFKNIVITPRHRYAFKEQLEQAMHQGRQTEPLELRTETPSGSQLASRDHS